MANISFSDLDVSDALAQLVSMQSSVEEILMAPMQGIIEEVTGGVWVGNGADAFVEELNSRFLPDAQRTFDSIGAIHESFSKGSELINAADRFARAYVDDFVDEYVGGIFGSGAAGIVKSWF